jgi:putrescine transport system substrate-binding protein
VRVSARPALRLAAGLGWLWALQGCNGHVDGPGPAGAGDAERILNIYTWTDYIAPDTVANFERETGIRVRYDTYDSNEVLETKLLTGRTNYDIVVPTGPFFERLSRAGVFRKLDQDALPNRRNLDPDVMRRLAAHDPGNAYAVPYLWSTAGIGYNVDRVRERLGSAAIDSWAILFDPRNAAKLSDCGITVIDSPFDVLAAALLYLGRDPNTHDPGDAAAAAAVLMKIRPYVRTIDSVQYISDLANGGICAALGWSGDVLQARDRAVEAGNGVKIAYAVPREGSLILFDMMGVPADAPHPHNAAAWMNFLMRPDVIAGITNFVKYPNGNAASLPLVKAAIRDDPAIYPTAETRAKLSVPLAEPADFSRLVTRLWTRFRTGD